MNSNYNQLAMNAFSDFVKQYPSATSADYQTFIIGFKACWDALHPDDKEVHDVEQAEGQDEYAMQG